MEVLQQIRDSDYAGFQAYNGTYCLDKGQTTLGGVVNACNAANVDMFIRSIQIQQNGCAANSSRVTVQVAWIDTNCAANSYCQKIPLVTCLSTVNPVQAL